MALHAYLPQDRRRALALGHALPELDRGAVLFADISGFTTLTETLTHGSGARRGVEEVARRINAVHQALIDEVERRAGSVIGFAGDGLTCWFAADAADVDRAASAAARCALALQRAMRRFPELSVKVGLAAGAVQRLVVGDPALQCIDLLAGATVARAARAERLADAGDVVADAAVVRAAMGGAAAAAGVQAGAARTAPDGEVFHPLRDDGSPADDSPATVSVPAAEPDAAVLRPWVLPFVAQRELASGGLFATDLRPATAVFVRLALGTAGADDDLAAEADRAGLARHVAQVQRLLRDHGGVLLEVAVDASGTALYGNFGAAHVHEDDGARALRAALALRQQLDDAGLAAQIGVSAGTLCVGGYGSASRRSYGAIGDEVNTAARLMSLAQPGEILASGRVRQAAGDDVFAAEPRPPIAMKGKSEPLPVFAITGLQQRRAIRLQEPAALLPMVGRAAEAAVLAEVIEQARDGHGSVLRIVGDAGMGKSRLLAEGIRLARRAGFIGYGGACRLDGVRTPYLVWQGIWTAFFDLDPALPQRRLRAAVQAELQALAPEHVEAWPLLGAVLGQDWPDAPFTAALQPKDRKALLEAVLLRCLEGAAAEAAQDGHSLLLVLEDLHAADPLSRELLAAVARAVATLPVLVLATERPQRGAADGPAQALAALPHVRQLELAGIGLADVEHIVRGKLALRFPDRSGPVPTELLARMAERAQGNPFYVEQLLDSLHDRGLDPRRPEAVQALELPASLHGLVLARLDRLPATQQGLLKAASIIGREFTLAELHGYCPTLGTADAVAADLAELARLGHAPALPDAAEPTHVFGHLVTLEASYESIGHETRARLHGQYARYVEGRAPGGVPLRLAPLLAHHHERAGSTAEACRYHRLAGEQAAARYANAEALAHFERALQGLAAADLDGHWDVLRRRVALHDLLGRRDSQRHDLEALERLAPRLADAELRRAEAATLRATLEAERGDYAAAGAAAAAAIAALDEAPAERADAAMALRVAARLQQARAALASGDAAGARGPIEQARTLADTRLAGHPLRIQALSQAAAVAHHDGDYAAAERVLHEALALAAAHDEPRRRVNLLGSLGVMVKAQGRHDEAAAHYAQALELARRIGDRPGEAMLLNNLGSACLAAGRHDEAARHSEAAARMYADAGEPVQHALALVNFAEAHRERGEPARALVLSAQALALLRASGFRAGEALVLENTGLAEAALGRRADALASLREAVRIAADIGAPAREASARLHLGQVQAAAGDAAAAEASLDAADALSRTLGDDALTLEIDAAQALRLLEAGRPADALRRLESRLLPRLLAEPAPGVAELPPALHAAALRVLRGSGDARAAAIETRGRAALVGRAAHTDDLVPHDPATPQRRP